MKKIAFAGTFDPLTNGHIGVIKEGLDIAEEVVVMIADNPNKKTLFNEKERKEMIEQSLKDEGINHCVKVVVIKNEYIAQSALQHGCSYLIRGIRKASEFDYEQQIQDTNAEVLMGAKTIFVMPSTKLKSVSSSYIKSLIGPVGWHWMIKEFIPKAVYEVWIKRYIKTTVERYLTSEIWTKENIDTYLHAVFTAYLGEHRYYHNLEHITHGLQELEWATTNHNFSTALVEKIVVSLLAHDIIYNSNNKESSDEEQSAIWFEEFARKIGMESEEATIIADMVRTTAYLSNPKIVDKEAEAILCSIDLAILAQGKNVYQWYTKMVRKEYAHVNEKAFVNGRIQALEKIVSRDKLYMSPYFSHYEVKAKNNLYNEIAELKKIKEEKEY